MVHSWENPADDTTSPNMSSLLFLYIFIVSFSQGTSTAPCPCSDEKLCQRITTSPEKEVLAWSTSSLVWLHYDWSVVTTIGVFHHEWDNKLMCYAHSKGVKVVIEADFNLKDLSNEQKKSEWIANLTQTAINNHADGVNIDVEQPIKNNSKEEALFTDLITRLSESFKKNMPGSQVTLDGTFSPDCIGGRCYDFLALSKVLDFIVLMDYDMVGGGHYPDCIASANSPFNATISGIARYLDLGIKPDKLVMGLPWYGYTFPCQYISGVDKCHYNCKNASGSQLYYSHVKDLLLARSDSGRKWDEATQSPYFDYYDMYGQRHQMWYDDPESVRVKLEHAKGLGLRGAAIWTSDMVDYSPLKRSMADKKAMWDAIGIIKENEGTVNEVTSNGELAGMNDKLPGINDLIHGN